MSISIDLSQLPAPTVIELLDFEQINAEVQADLIARMPELADVLQLPSEPVTKLVEVFAYRELLLRSRINDAARAVMLAYAGGADLDQLGALLDVARLTITPADPANNIAEDKESDTDLRKRIQLAPEGFSVAGPAGSYIYHALEADGRVLDASVQSPAPGEVLVTVLARDADGSAPANLIAAVAAALSADTVRPITDAVSVQSAHIVPYQVQATLYTFPGPDSGVVLAKARAQLDAYIAECHRLGREVVISGIHAALHSAGIERVELVQPAANIAISSTQAPYCTAVTLTYGGIYG